MNSSLLLNLQVTQMKYRLAEGNGECFYFIGESQLTNLVYVDTPNSTNLCCSCILNHDCPQDHWHALLPGIHELCCLNSHMLLLIALLACRGGG